MTVKKLRSHATAKYSSKQRAIFNKIADKMPYVSIFDHKQDNQPKRTKLTLEMFTHAVRPDKDGAMFNSSKFDGTRGNDNFVSANAALLDFDKGNPTIEEIRAAFPNNLLIIYTTHSHTPEKPRYRVVLPLSRSVNAKEHQTIGRAIKEKLTPKLRKCLDETCLERARPHYLPACPPDQAKNAKSRFFDGSPLNANKLIALGKELPSAKAIKSGTKADKSGDRLGDDYVRRHSIIDVMLENGWTRAKDNKWSKPGKTSGDYQAKLYGDGVYVYSTSAPVPKGFHDAFGFLVHSSYAGDFSAAASDLKKKGYGGAAASNSAPKRLFITPSQLQNNQRKTDSLVGNLIRQGTTGQIFGPSEAGKTFISLDLALSIATGKDWNGYKCHQGLVAYCVGEGWSGFRNRIKAWETANDNPDVNLFHASQNVISFEGTELKVVADELKLYEQETGHKVALIVIDTLARHIEGDENSSSEISKFINKVDGLRGNFPGSSAIIVHHSGHGHGGRARGSSALKAAMDFEINCNKNALTFTKMKDGAKPDPIDFKLDVVEVGTDANGDPVTSCVVNYGKKPEHSSKKTRTGSPKLSDIESIAVKGLVLASVKCQFVADGKYGADLKTWRSAFYELRKEQDEDIPQGTLKTSFSRAMESLLELGHIEKVEKVIILTNPALQKKISNYSA